MAEKPAVHLYAPEPGTARRTTETTRHTVPIHDGRQFLEPPSLDEQGFALEPCETAVADLYAADAVRSAYARAW